MYWHVLLLYPLVALESQWLSVILQVLRIEDDTAESSRQGGNHNSSHRDKQSSKQVSSKSVSKSTSSVETLGIEMNGLRVAVEREWERARRSEEEVCSAPVSCCLLGLSGR